jgi:hypothetical protein
VAAGRGAPQADALRVDAEVAGVGAQMAQCLPQVHDLRRVRVLRCQPVVDGHHREAPRGEVTVEVGPGVPVLEPPSATVQPHDDGPALRRRPAVGEHQVILQFRVPGRE